MGRGKEEGKSIKGEDVYDAHDGGARHGFIFVWILGMKMRRDVGSRRRTKRLTFWGDGWYRVRGSSLLESLEAKIEVCCFKVN